MNDKTPRQLRKASRPSKPALQMPERPEISKQASDFARQRLAAALRSPTGSDVLGQLFCPDYRGKANT